MIYFAQVDTGAIKIGTTSRFPERMRYHGKNGIMSLLGIHDGGREEELAVHRRFAHLRIKRRLTGSNPEHFRPGPELLSYIAANCREPSESEATAEARAMLVGLPPEIHKQLRIEAAKQDMSMAALVRRWTEENLARLKKGGK